MNSSISNSNNSRRSELLVISSILALLAGLEMTLRLLEARLSLDETHIGSIASIVAKLGLEPAPRVLFLGNSLTRESIVPQNISSIWESRAGIRPHIAKIHPDDTTILDWYYLYRRHFHQAAERPDLIVVGFAGSQLEDQPEPHVDRLARHFAGFGDCALVFQHELRTLDQRVRYLLSATFRIMANRERVQLRVLAAFPGYSALANAINQSVRQQLRVRVARTGPPFSALQRFLQQARAHQDHIVFVAIPLPSHYPIPLELASAIREAGMELLDMQEPTAFVSKDFPDAYHLGHSAAERFSSKLASAMLTNLYTSQAINNGALILQK